MNLTIKEMKKISADNGNHFFDKETMKLFESKIESAPDECGLFITSEKCPFFRMNRAYTVRSFSPETGRVITIYGSLISMGTAMGARTNLKSALKSGIGDGSCLRAVLDNLAEWKINNESASIYQLITYPDKDGNRKSFSVDADQLKIIEWEG